MEIVGEVCVLAGGVPGVEVDAAEVDYPEEAREVLNDRKIHDIGGWVTYVTGGNPWGFGIGGMFLEKEFAEGSIGVALHNHGAVTQVGQQYRRDIGVVLEEVAFGDFVFGPEGFLEIGQADLVAIDF